MSLQFDVSTTPNPLKTRDAELFDELTRFRARFEGICIAPLDTLLNDRTSCDRGHFLPREDIKAVAHILQILTKNSWTPTDIAKFDEFWRHTMRSDFFADEFESSRFRIQGAVDAARTELAEHPIVEQPTLW